MKKIAVFCAVLVMLIFASCSDSPGKPPVVKVYNAGITTSNRAAYWVGATPVALETPIGSGDSRCAAITVAGDKVYTAGSYVDMNGGFYKACYWDEGSFTSLHPTGEAESFANGIAVSGGIVYIAGVYSDGSTEKACYWVGTNPPVGLWHDWSNAIAITVSGGTVFTAGAYYDGSDDGACYWVGSNPPVSLHPVGIGSSYSFANAITVSGGTVYTAGYYAESGGELKPCYWKGTEFFPLESPVTTMISSGPLGITVSGGTVYIGGLYTGTMGNRACYWEGTKLIDLHPVTALSSSVRAITIHDGSVYAAGGFSDAVNVRHPCFWKDGNSYELGTAVGAGGFMSSFIVIE